MARTIAIGLVAVVGFIKEAILLIAGIIALIDGLHLVSTAHRETDPTKMSIEELPVKFHDQRWLSLTGRLDLTRATSRILPGREGQSQQEIFIPLIAASASSSDPVRVLIQFGPNTNGYPSDFLSQFSSDVAEYTGARIGWDTSAPNKQVFSGPTAEPFIMFQINTRPPTAATGWWIAGIGALCVRDRVNFGSIHPPISRE